MKILFLQTGGTIDKDYPRTTKGYAFEIGEPAVKRILAKVNPSFEYEIVSLLQKDSLDIMEEDRDRIYDECRNSRLDTIIITHGTDTIIDTAKKLSSLKGKTIILTAAMRPEKFADSDADFNLGTAVGAAGTLGHGVYIAMHGRVLRHDRVQRDGQTGQFQEKG